MPPSPLGKKRDRWGRRRWRKKRRERRGVRRRDGKKVAPADRGKEAEQRKSIVRLLIEKWGRFMGYRQTELSASPSRSRDHLARAIARQVSLRFRLPFRLRRFPLRSRLSLPRAAERVVLGRAALTSSPRTPSSSFCSSRRPPFFSSSFYGPSTLADRLSPAAPPRILFHFFLARRRGESAAGSPFSPLFLEAVAPLTVHYAANC